MKRYFAVADPHSYFSELMSALDKKHFDIDNIEHYLIICGDAFDRGEESCEMFTFMRQLADKHRLIYVRGNHEELLFDAIRMIRNGDLARRGSHHFSNGTILTISHFTGYSKYDLLTDCYDRKQFENKIAPLTNFIEANTQDYFELGDTIFVHGWMPISVDSWKEARWLNGMEMFNRGVLPENKKTIVCGHWHTSWGWKHFGYTTDEWDENAKFDTLIVDKNNHKLVALDACTAYTHKINCIVFDEEGNIQEV